MNNQRFKTVCIMLALVLLVSCVALFLISTTADAAVIKQGSSGETVRKIQTKLKNWGYYTGSVDGIFGSKTLAAVKYFQRKNGLVVDGIVGTKTAAAMGISLSSSSGGTGSGTTSNSNLYLLACCIYGEARGEKLYRQSRHCGSRPQQSKKQQLPQHNQRGDISARRFYRRFDGQINLGTNDECIRAAQDALNGWDPTYGCIYYYNPQTATNQWIRSRPIVVTIGKHVFCT